jgi:predicted DNA-binding transcriptional regulator YafY
MGSEGSESKIKFTISITGRKRAAAEFLQIEKISGSGEIEIEAYSPEWVAKTVTSFAPDMTLIAPSATRGEIRASMEKILDLYRS